MALFDFREGAETLDEILDRERAAILEGQFDVIERLTPAKERALDRLKRRPPDGVALGQLRGKVERNGRLLEAMRAGLASAQERLKALRERPSALRTYDAKGRRTSLCDTGGEPPKRA
ncbi:hypothetical protein [Pseudoruegeria sp. HB172150]|uniref:hypothetical protein n=1 Tax=Pseudoruegeria sp. HB172150 TaxID=2721164 RepID=UPI0015582D24|nr:hypothetical protein [Pseudoruegeria sp. HB172150]